MTEIPDWLNPTPGGTTGHPPDGGLGLQQWNAPSQDEMRHMRAQLLESVLSAVVQAVRGLFIPGPFGAALEQLVDWATGLPLIGPLVEAITGVVGGTMDTIADFFGGFVAAGGSIIEQLAETLTGLPGTLADIALWVSELPLIGPIVEAITGIVGGGLDTLAGWFGGFAAGAGSLLEQLVNAFTGLPGTLGDIVTWVENLPLIGPLVEAITGVVGGGLSTISDFFGGFIAAGGSLIEQIVSAFTGLPGTLADIVTWVESLPLIGPLVEAITGIPGTIADIALWAVDVLTGRSPLFSGNLFGQIGAGIIGLIPGAHVAEVSPNLLADGDFPDPASLEGDAVWEWDGTTGHTYAGCASVDCNGIEKDLSSELIYVAQGHVLACSGWTLWSSLSATNTVSLELTCYQNVGTSNRPDYVVVDEPEIRRDTSGLANSGWRELSGSYTVPAGVDAVRLRAHVDATATTGTVKWDDLSLTKTQKMSLGLLDGLTDIIGNIWQTIQDIFDAIVSAIRRVPLVGNVLADTIEALEDLVGLTHNADDNATSALDQLAGLLWNLLNAPATVLGFIVDDLVPGIARTLENIWNGLTGQSDTEGVVGHAEATAVLTATAEALTAAQAEIVQLKQMLTSGVSVVDGFGRDEGNAGAGWTLMPVGSSVSYPTGGGGHAQTDGNNLTWQDSGNTPTTQLYRWTGTGQHSNSRYQAISMVLSTRGEDPLFGTTSGNHILARVSDDGLNYLRLQVNAYVGNTSNPLYQLFYCVGGVEQRLWWKDSGAVPGAGSVISLLAGLQGQNDRTHTVVVNNNIIDQITESSPVSWLSTTPNTMGWGLGMSAGDNIGIWPFLRQAKPAKINTWTAQDQ